MIKGLYFVTDSNLTKQGIVADAMQVIEAGCKLVQYREKKKRTAEMVKEAMQLKQVCEEKGVVFIVDDRIDVALAVGADGVHLGHEDMPVSMARKLLGNEKIIGKSTHCLEEALKAESQGCNYVSVGPVFHTNTKKDAGKPVGLELVKQVKSRVKLPVVAIGGINEENAAQVMEAGADSVAIISAIVCSDNPGEAAKRLINKIGEQK